MGAFYLVFGPMELSAGLGYTTRNIGTHAAIAQDEVRQDRKDRLARGALDAPDGEPVQSNPSIMGVSGQTPTTGAGRLVCELKAQGEEKGQHAFDKGLAISQELKVGRLVLKINGDGAVVPCPFARLSHVSPLW
jgi:MoaA/NifB/PqqE/SkfB family radical SAM enzyme